MRTIDASTYDNLRAGITERLGAAMAAAKMSQVSMAKAMGISRATLNIWMRGGGSFPVDKAIVMCYILKVDMTWVFTGKEPDFFLQNRYVKELVDSVREVPRDALPYVVGMMKRQVSAEPQKPDEDEMDIPGGPGSTSKIIPFINNA